MKHSRAVHKFCMLQIATEIIREFSLTAVAHFLKIFFLYFCNKQKHGSGTWIKKQKNYAITLSYPLCSAFNFKYVL